VREREGGRAGGRTQAGESRLNTKTEGRARVGVRARVRVHVRRGYLHGRQVNTAARRVEGGC